MDERLVRIKHLIGEIEQKESELNTLLAGGSSRKPQKCSKCGQEGHSARTCTAESITTTE